MLTPIKYEEYHKIYGDHLMRDIDIPPAFRIVEIEFYNRETKWYKTETASFALTELVIINKPIRSVLIT